LNIKEAEVRTGLARANIRYYEDQGFLTPARGENGYRDYSGGDIDVLLKVKLLRQLGFSLEEIHRLQSGQQALEPALERRAAGLEGESRELSQAAGLCRAMREDGADFAALDARRYLDRLAQGADILAEDQAPRRAFHWRRYFARNLDLLCWSTVATVLLQIAIGWNPQNELQGQALLRVLLTLLLAGTAEALLLHYTGTTPGKALFGLKLLREDGSFLSLAQAARRTGGALAAVGLVSLVSTLIQAWAPALHLGVSLAVYLVVYSWLFWCVREGKPLYWENEDQVYLEGSTKDTPFWGRRGSWLRVVVYAAVCLACAGLRYAGSHAALAPPNPGPDLTVAQFVENYNYFAGRENSYAGASRLLTEEGTFIDKPARRASYALYDWEGDGMAPLTTFHFVERDGLLAGMTLFRGYEGTGPVPENTLQDEFLPYSHLRLALLALGWDRETAGAVCQEVMDAGGNLERELPGGRVDCALQFSGYYICFQTNIREYFLRGRAGDIPSYSARFTVTLTR